MTDTQTLRFYDDQLRGSEYATPLRPDQHPYSPLVKRFVEDYQLAHKRCLEVGCGRGAFQDVVDDYTGLDISAEASRYLHKPFVRADATHQPFPDDEFDAVWSITVLEHVPEPEVALQEICRVIKSGGVVFMAPAWHTRSWFADGYPVRSYAQLSWKGKLIKLSIPIRDFTLYRYLRILLRRSLRLIQHLRRPGAMPLKYVRLRPNFERYWMSDSDAVNSLDPFDFILWFASRGHRCLSHPNRVRQLLVRDLALVFQISKGDDPL
jgi:SAM-dependent methyltransferase